MKIRSTCWIALAALAFSCTKENGTNNSGQGSMNATLSANPLFGTSFQSGAITGKTAIRANQEFDIYAWTANGKDSAMLELQFPDTLSLNTPFRDTTGVVFGIQLLYANSNANPPLVSYRNYYFKTPAVVTVTSYDATAKKIAGTFSGTVYTQTRDSVVISNGAFQVSFTSYP